MVAEALPTWRATRVPRACASRSGRSATTSRHGPRRRPGRRRPRARVRPARPGRPGGGARRPAGDRQPARWRHDRPSRPPAARMTEAPPAIRVALADDADLLRDALAASLAPSASRSSVARRTCRACWPSSRRTNPDVVIVDVGCRRPTRPRASRRAAAAPGPAGHRHPRAFPVRRDALRHRSRARRRSRPRVPAQGPGRPRRGPGRRRPAGRGRWLGDRPRGRRPAVGPARTHSPLDELTRREREVLGLMAEGRSNQGIAGRAGARAQDRRRPRRDRSSRSLPSSLPRARIVASRRCSTWLARRAPAAPDPRRNQGALGPGSAGRSRWKWMETSGVGREPRECR